MTRTQKLKDSGRGYLHGGVPPWQSEDDLQQLECMVPLRVGRSGGCICQGLQVAVLDGDPYGPQADQPESVADLRKGQQLISSIRMTVVIRYQQSLQCMPPPMPPAQICPR